MALYGICHSSESEDTDIVQEFVALPLLVLQLKLLRRGTALPPLLSLSEEVHHLALLDNGSAQISHLGLSKWGLPSMGVPPDGWFIRENPSING